MTEYFVMGIFLSTNSIISSEIFACNIRAVAFITIILTIWQTSETWP